MKPIVPDFCPACDAMPKGGFPIISEIRKIEHKGRKIEVESLAYQCECGFRMLGPGQLQDAINKINEKLGNR